jgi:hypothetical protein
MRHLIPALAVAVLASGGAGAEPQTPAASNPTPPSASGTGGSSFSVQNVDPKGPFGTIDTSSVLNGSATVFAFMGGLSQSQKDELSGRCAVINHVGNAPRYPLNVQDFCHSYITASVTPASLPAAPAAATSTGAPLTGSANGAAVGGAGGAVGGSNGAIGGGAGAPATPAPSR